jgi:hypothetical protein
MPPLRLFDSTMLWCGCWFVHFFVLVSIALPPGAHGSVDYRTSVAHFTVNKYANEDFRRWASAHPDMRRPAALTELDAYLADTRRDPWGQPYRMLCSDRGLIVYSAGTDGYIGTQDDIWSDR